MCASKKMLRRSVYELNAVDHVSHGTDAQRSVQTTFDVVYGVGHGMQRDESQMLG